MWIKKSKLFTDVESIETAAEDFLNRIYQGSGRQGVSTGSIATG
jgi:hypothetical protein